MGLDNYVKHADLLAFAEEKVNLSSEDAKEFRAQVSSTREKLAKYINEHPDFNLVKMLHSGSVAKGTALSDINDMDVAVYLKKSAAPANDYDLLNWLADRLREAYGDWKKHEDFVVNQHCVTVSFKGTGLDVDVVPVLYEGDSQDKGYLITKDTGQRVLTSIPMHLEFTRKRKIVSDPDYRQTIRFIKWWKRRVMPPEFRFKSFMIELIVAHLVGQGLLPKGNYIEALLSFFSYIARTGLKERIVFGDYYLVSQAKNSGHPIQVFDPVNPANNVAAAYSDNDRETILNAALEAIDAINYGRRATTKAESESAWKDVLGPSFKVTI
jgi:Second Messenger Oligonucleotide or Dinucleotide Synthetase domain